MFDTVSRTGNPVSATTTVRIRNRPNIVIPDEDLDPGKTLTSSSLMDGVRNRIHGTNSSNFSPDAEQHHGPTLLRVARSSTAVLMDFECLHQCVSERRSYVDFRWYPVFSLTWLQSRMGLVSQDQHCFPKTRRNPSPAWIAENTVWQTRSRRAWNPVSVDLLRKQTGQSRTTSHTSPMSTEKINSEFTSNPSGRSKIIVAPPNISTASLGASNSDRPWHEAMPNNGHGSMTNNEPIRARPVYAAGTFCNGSPGEYGFASKGFLSSVTTLMFLS